MSTTKVRMGARKLSELFFQLVPRRVVKRKWIPPAGLSKLGACARVDYVSDKFDEEMRYYFHEFEGRCELAAAVDKKGQKIKGMLIILGDFDITELGIEG